VESHRFVSSRRLDGPQPIWTFGEESDKFIAVCWELLINYSVLSPSTSHYVECTVPLILMYLIDLRNV
jgi:hypothetical protein